VSTRLIEMGKRHSRLSTDDGPREQRDSSPSSYEQSRCPSCGHQKLTTVNVDDELLVRVCGGCDRAWIDDWMDAETLALLLVDEELCRDVQMTAVTCDQCLNDDVDLFEIVDELDPDRLALRVRCLVCSSVSDISLNNWTSGGEYAVDNEDGHDIGGHNNVGVSLDTVPFSCQCGNNEVDCFEKHHDASGDLSSVTCLVCYRHKVLETFFGVECSYCENDRKELFERRVDDYGRLTSLRCLVCDKRLHLPGHPTPREKRTDDCQSDNVPTVGRRHMESQVAKVDSRVGLGWTKLAELRHVQRGDHVAWHKWYAVWHHAIVVDVPDGGRALTVIHYNGDIVKLDGHFASVRLETLDVNPTKEDLYRIDYPPGNVYPVDEVIERACSRLDEAKYNPFTNNCEHFARWCKTGRAECGQVRKFTGRLGLAFQSAVTKTTQEAAVDGFESLVAGSISKVGFSSISDRAGQVFGATSGVIRNVKCGALACNVAVNLALEAAMFTKDGVIAYRSYKSGAISRDEFRRQLCKLGCECTGGLIGASTIGILGQLFIPVPFLGSFVGCTLGNLIGRYAGAVIGKQLAAIKH